jgi:hypothetical protein
MSPAYAQVDRLLDEFSGSTSELLSVVIKRFYTELADNVQRRAIMRILITEGDRFPNLTAYYYREVFASAQRLISRIIQRGIDSGEFCETIAIEHPGVIAGPVVMAALWKMTFESNEPLDIERFSGAHVDVMLNGLRKR